MKIYGYYFAILSDKAESGYVAYAPGIGGIYEEGETEEEAVENAYQSACALMDARIERGDPIVEENQHIKILTELPHRKIIDKYRDIKDGYIATPSCSILTLA